MVISSKLVLNRVTKFIRFLRMIFFNFHLHISFLELISPKIMNILPI